MSGRSFDMVRAKPSAKVPIKKSAPPPPVKKKRSLREKRERARSRFSFLVFVLVALIVGAIIYGLWRPEVRITHVEVGDMPHADEIEELVQEHLSGRYLGIVPRDSIFFFPEQELVSAVLEAVPSVQDVRVGRTSFTSLVVEGVRRDVAFLWCGEHLDHFSPDVATCYEVDAEGLVFAMVSASTTAMHDPETLRVYAPLSSDADPVRGVVEGAPYIPTLMSFVSAIKGLGVPVLAVYMQGDEAELLITPETRLIYVLGDEEEALATASATLPDLSLLSGTIEYIDMRFADKVYVKRYGEE